MANEEWEMETEEHPVATHFKQSLDQIELAKKLERYHEVCVEMASLKAIHDALREELLELGKGEQSISAGNFAAFFQKVSGRVSTDWKQAFRDLVGEMKEEDVSKYVRKGDDSIRVEVKRLG